MACSNTGPEVDRLVAHLTEAIHTGQAQAAKECVALLSERHLSLNIKISDIQYGQRSKEKEFIVIVHVEDQESTGIKLDLSVRPSDTVADVKRKLLVNFNFPIELQRLIIGKKIPDDSSTLKQCGICRSGYTIFLYVLPARSVGRRRSDSGSCPFGNEVLETSGTSPGTMSNILSYEEQGKMSGMLMNQNSMRASPTGKRNNGPETDLMPALLDIAVQDVDDPEETRVVQSVGPFVKTKQPKDPGWECAVCTYFNLPTRPGCEMCSADRPEDYVVPDGYEMTDREFAMMAHQEELERMSRLDHEEDLREKFKHWQQLDDQDLISNTSVFTCPICFDDFEPGEGIVLRECMHQFCKDCLQGAVTHSEEPSLQCPYQDDDQTCDSTLQEREIRALVPEDVFTKYLQRSLDQAESQAANSFHCKSTDCKGWCIYEDEVNFFVCPTCMKENCLTCKVIHEGMNCKEYQADLALKAVNDEAARQTQKLIQGMVNDGTAMHCPQCQIIVQKKDGCDWLKCSVCKTEICWVTKGPRWGPRGHGDTSGGCRCGIKGRCHPNCANCH